MKFYAKFFTQKSQFFLFIILFGLFMLGCKKTATPPNIFLAENISKQELANWISIYKKLLPEGPIPLLDKTTKTYYQGQMVLKMPLSSGGGNFYFTKTDHLIVQFIRVVSADDQINIPFNGYYEFIDMTTYSYKKISFKNGIQTASIRKQHIQGQTIKNTSLKSTNNSWLGQFLWCLAHYIAAVPARDASGAWGG